MPTGLQLTSSPPDDPAAWRCAAWPGGAFVSGVRPFTPEVHSTITAADQHLVLVTLRGGAARARGVDDAGHRYDRADRPGTASFLPAGCGRRGHIERVAWHWAAIAIQSTPLTDGDDVATGLAGLPPIGIEHDPLILAVLSACERQVVRDGTLDPLYGQSMAAALAMYLLGRSVGHGVEPPRATLLPAWRLRRVVDFVEEHLDSELSITALAGVCDLSERHFHRAFRQTTGQTPLAYVTARRVARAQRLLEGQPLTMREVSRRVGFQSPTHFARVFRAATGVAPAVYRSLTTVGDLRRPRAEDARSNGEAREMHR